MGVSGSLLLQTKALKVRMLQRSQNLEKVITFGDFRGAILTEM